MIKYGLMYNKAILNFNLRQNNDDVHELCEWGDKMWLIDTPEHANYVRFNTTPWYNASYDTPINSYRGEELQVVEVEMIVRNAAVNALPTFEELVRVIYKDDPELDYVLRGGGDYSLYDYLNYLEKQ